MNPKEQVIKHELMLVYQIFFIIGLILLAFKYITRIEELLTFSIICLGIGIIGMIFTRE